MAVKTMMSNRAKSRTRGLKSGLLASRAALLSQPDFRLMAMGTANKSPIGIPTRNWRKTRLRRRRFCSQYRTKSFPCCVSIDKSCHTKVARRQDNLSLSMYYGEVFLSYELKIHTA